MGIADKQSSFQSAQHQGFEIIQYDLKPKDLYFDVQVLVTFVSYLIEYSNMLEYQE